MKQTIYAGNIAGLTHSKPDFDALAVGEILQLTHEVYNEYDVYAVRVDTGTGVKLGYIPKESTIAWHQANANGFNPVAVITEINTAGRFPKVHINVSISLS